MLCPIIQSISPIPKISDIMHNTDMNVGLVTVQTSTGEQEKRKERGGSTGNRMLNLCVMLWTLAGRHAVAGNMIGWGDPVC